VVIAAEGIVDSGGVVGDQVSEVERALEQELSEQQRSRWPRPCSKEVSAKRRMFETQGGVGERERVVEQC